MKNQSRLLIALAIVFCLFIIFAIRTSLHSYMGNNNQNTASDSRWKTYHNKELGYSFNYPLYFSQERNNIAVAVPISPKEEGLSSTQIPIDISVMNINDLYWFGIDTANLELYSVNFQKLSMLQNITINGWDGYEGVVKDSGDKVIIVADNNNLYRISILSKYKDNDIANQIVNSFNLDNPGTIDSVILD